MRIDSTIIGPDDGMPVFIRTWPDGLVNRKTPSPLVPTKYRRIGISNSLFRSVAGARPRALRAREAVGRLGAVMRVTGMLVAGARGGGAGGRAIINA